MIGAGAVGVTVNTGRHVECTWTKSLVECYKDSRMRSRKKLIEKNKGKTVIQHDYSHEQIINGFFEDMQSTPGGDSTIPLSASLPAYDDGEKYTGPANVSHLYGASVVMESFC